VAHPSNAPASQQSASGGNAAATAAQPFQIHDTDPVAAAKILILRDLRKTIQVGSVPIHIDEI
jgi:hypothetical protein